MRQYVEYYVCHKSPTNHLNTAIIHIMCTQNTRILTVVSNAKKIDMT